MQDELFGNTEYEGLITSEREYHMVVVGTIDHVTTHEVVINYNEGNSQVTVKREDFGASGPAGVEHPDLDTLNRAFGIKQCICFSCENNNEGNQVRRQRVATVDSEGNEKAQIITCNMCDGKGTVIEWARGFSPAIDTHWMDIVEVLEQGYAPDHSIPTFASMMKGGRDSITNQWDVQITPVAMGAMKDGVFHVDGRYAMRKNGDGVEVKTFIADLIQHYNQQYATPDMPLGMKIGRPKTGQYATTQHRDVIPMFKAWCDSRGLKSNAYGMNHGQEAYLDIEVSSKGTRQEILQSMRTEGRTIDEETLRPVALSKDPRGVVSFGIQIKSSFDGAIQFCAIAERVVCLNGMVGTRTEVLLALTHKHASMALLEIDGLEHKVMTAALAMYEQASQIEAMNYIMLEVADFERALVIAAERGLLTMPGLGLNGNLTGGRTLRTAIEGWHNPSADFVLVGEDYNGIPNSLYHLNNIFNGAITHQPPTNDAHGLVTGGKAIGMNRTQQMLRGFQQLTTDIQMSAFHSYVEKHGREPSEDQLRCHVQAHGIPMLDEVETNANGHYLPILTSRVGDDGNYREMQLTTSNKLVEAVQ